MTTKSGVFGGAWLDQDLRPEVQRYRKELLDRIFRPFALFGFVALTFGSWRAIQDGQWGFAVVYFGCYVTGTAVAIGFKRMSVQSRSNFLLIGLLALALAALLRLGLGGVGSLVLVALCGLTGILRGFRASLVAVGIAFVMLGAVGAAMVTGLIVLPTTQLQTSVLPGAWISHAISFAAITAGLIIPIQTLSGKLTQSVSELEASNERLRREIERREQAEAASRASELRYRGIFESATVGIMEQDWSALRGILQGLEDEEVEDLRAHLDRHPEHVREAVSAIQVRDVNPAILEIFGAESKDELLQSWGSVFGPESFDGFRDLLVALDADHRVFKGELDGRQLNGDPIRLLIQAALSADDDDLALVSILDITARRRLERSLAEAQKMEAIGTLAGGIAHDFNNILMSIGGYAALLLRAKGHTARQRGHLESIHQMVESGAGVTRQLLGFARGGKYDVLTTDLREQLHGSLALFGRAKREIQTEEDLPQDLWTVDVDRPQLEQVMLNLYVNAWQAMPQGGEIRVSGQNVTLGVEAASLRHLAPGDYVRIMVRDNGAGMDEATRARVFEPFFTTKGLGRGTGLGLASAYGILKNHGGMIEVDSEPGHGATFTIHLPASKKPLTAAEDSATETQQGHETLLLVDDQRAVLKSTALLLEDLGYQVHSALDGERALELYEEHRQQVALVILDLIMPAMSGAELVERLRALSPELPILVSSGYSQDDRADPLVQNGNSSFMQKPFGIDDLSNKLREMLDAD